MPVCSRCNAKCCAYMAVEIDKPAQPADFDTARWMLAHRNISIFIDAGRWYLHIAGRCRYLGRGSRCKIYASRPKICLTHKAGDCEVKGVFDHEFLFNAPDDLEKYMLSKGLKFPARWARLIRSRAPEGSFRARRRKKK